jgi:hypothetical protein
LDTGWSKLIIKRQPSPIAVADIFLKLVPDTKNTMTVVERVSGTKKEKKIDWCIHQSKMGSFKK